MIKSKKLSIFVKYNHKHKKLKFENLIYGINMRLISQFISEQGKILSRRLNKLSLKQQRLITIIIKQARILSLLPFINYDKQ